jgi:uncharacterized membrane protein YbhN (UPF0104 family)
MAALSMPPRVRRVILLAFGAAVIVGTVAVVGAGPLLRGLQAISPAAVLAAALLCAVATCAAAWRWRTVSSELGVAMPWSAAVASYYRSQFVNTVLPGGVVGDVHRAYRQGASTGELALAARAVVTERVAGQLVQGVTTVGVLVALGMTAPLAGLAPAVGWAAVVVAGLLVAAVVVAFSSRRARAILSREVRLVRSVFRTPRAALSIVAASLVVVAAHVGTFVVAGLAVGIEASPGELVGLALIALAAASLPLNVGGWGPREAASATAFAAAGLGAGAGLAVSTAFGVLTVVAVLPGAVVLIAGLITARKRERRRAGADRSAAIDPIPTVHPLPEERAA